MTKILNKWLRKTHRWLAVPTAVLIPLAVVVKLTKGSLVGFPPQLEILQSLLMLLLALSGAYLFLLPYLTRWQRQRRRN